MPPPSFVLKDNQLPQLIGMVRRHMAGSARSIVSATESRFVLSQPRGAYKNQVGPTCGLYALRNVMRYHYNALAQRSLPQEQCLRRAPQLAARKLEQRDAVSDTHAEDLGGLWVPAGLSLREIAKASGLTGVGELLSGRCLVTLAQKLGYQASWGQHLGGGYVAAIKSALQRSIPPIVAFDVHNGGPTQALGAHGHWIMVVGYEKYVGLGSSCDVVYVMHWGSFYAFPLMELMTSAQQLQRFPAGTLQKQNHAWNWQPKPIDLRAPSDAPRTAEYVDRGFFSGRAQGLRLTDVTHSLRGAIVEVQPATAPRNTFAPVVRSEIDEYNANMDHWWRRPSAQSKAAAQRLDQLLRTDVGLTELLDAVLYYTTPHASRNPRPHVNLGDKLKPSSTLCSQLKKAIHHWCAA